MIERESTDDAAVIVEFLQLYLADRQSGLRRAAADYQARFPGFEAAVAREFETLERSDAMTGQSDRACDTVDCADTPPPEWIGGRYEDLGLLGQGAMGIVRRVRDHRLRRELALKLLGPTDKAKGATTDSRQWRRFLDEALITSQLAHPGITPVHDLCVEGDGRIYFTMGLIEGCDFGVILDRVRGALVGSGADAETWDMTRAVGVLLRVCEAVAFAHAKGVIHRDLKPQNVMVGAFGQTYVVDWGLARVIEGPSSGRAVETCDSESRTGTSPADPASLSTVDGDVLGTPAYMPPEQALGQHAQLGVAADVYAIGAMLYHLLTGRAPYAAEDGRIGRGRQLIAAVIAGPPVALAKLAPAAPAELVAICERAMMRAPSARYASAADLANDLRAFLELRVVRAYEHGALAEAKKWVRRNRPLALTGLAALVALCVALAISWAQMRIADRHAAAAAAEYQLARDAIDRMVVRVGTAGLADVPQTERVRRDLLLDALDFHRRLALRHPDALASRRDLAQTLSVLAKLHNLLGDYRLAEAAAAEAIDCWEQLAADDPAEPAHVIAALGPRNDLAQSLVHRGEVELARAEFARALEHAERCLVIAPGELEVLRKSAILRNNATNLLTRAHDWGAALAPRRHVAELAERIVALAPDDVGDRLFACIAFTNLGVTCGNLGEFADAERALDRAFECCRRMSVEESTRRANRDAIAGVWRARARVLLATERAPAAIEPLREVERAYRGLVRDYPTVPDYHYEHAGSLNNLAGAVHGAGDHSGARELLAAALQAYADALALAPENNLYRQRERDVRVTMCGVLLESGATEALAACAERLVPTAPLDAAIYLAHCAGLAIVDTSDWPSERLQRRAAAGDRVIGLLQRAAASDANRPRLASVLTAPVFDALRDRDTFVELQRAADSAR